MKKTNHAPNKSHIEDEEIVTSSEVKNDTYTLPKNLVNVVLALLLLGIGFLAGNWWNEHKASKNSGTAGNNVANNDAAQPPARPTELKIAKPSDKDHWRNKDARFVFVEYSDLECPFCKKLHPDLNKLMEEYDGKLGQVFRHFPLQFHAKAQKTAEAIECAAELGGEDSFWKLQDAIFEKMPDVELSELPALAADQGLNQSEFKQCLDSGKYAQKVKDQLDEGVKAGVQATPTGVVYDMKTGKTKLIEGAVPYEQLKSDIDAFIKQQEG